MDVVRGLRKPDVHPVQNKCIVIWYCDAFAPFVPRFISSGGGRYKTGLFQKRSESLMN